MRRDFVVAISTAKLIVPVIVFVVVSEAGPH